MITKPKPFSYSCSFHYASKRKLRPDILQRRFLGRVRLIHLSRSVYVKCHVAYYPLRVYVFNMFNNNRLDLLWSAILTLSDQRGCICLNKTSSQWEGIKTCSRRARTRLSVQGSSVRDKHFSDTFLRSPFLTCACSMSRGDEKYVTIRCVYFALNC